METKHTKGEWIVNSQKNLVLTGKKWISDLSTIGFEEISEEERIANAKLISAAPDLLEALIEAKKVILSLNPTSVTEEQMNEYAIKGGVWDKIQTAINKATK